VIYASFLQVYDPIMASEMSAGRAGGESIVNGVSVSKYVMPVVNDITIIGGVIWAIAAYGFIKREKWAWQRAILANVLSLLSFFMLIPAMSRGISPIYVAVFVPNIIAFFLLTLYIKKIDLKIVAISTVAGMAYVMSFMNGVAATDQMLSGANNVFIIGERLSWVAALGWGAFVVALLTRKKWFLQLGLFASLLTLVASIPMGVVISVESAKFSMYFFAPLLALLLKISFIVPKSNQFITQWVNREAKPA
jgi:hypothetical protein